MMKFNPRSFSVVCVLMLVPAGWSANSLSGHTDDKQQLDVKSKGVARLENNATFGGYTKTRIFYTFAKERVILKVEIDNRDKAFPTTAMLYQFDESGTPDGLKKWLNNQTSDALFPNVPNPVKSTKIGKEACTIKSKKLTGEADSRFGKFAKYAVEFQFLKMGLVNGFEIKKFSDKATVYLKK